MRVNDVTTIIGRSAFRFLFGYVLIVMLALALCDAVYTPLSLHSFLDSLILTGWLWL